MKTITLKRGQQIIHHKNGTDRNGRVIVSARYRRQRKTEYFCEFSCWHGAPQQEWVNAKELKRL